MFHPDKYEWIYDEDKFTIKEIKKLDDRLPDRVVYNKIKHNDFKGFPLKVFNLNGEASSGHDIMISQGVQGNLQLVHSVWRVLFLDTIEKENLMISLKI